MLSNVTCESYKYKAEKFMCLCVLCGIKKKKMKKIRH